MSPTLNRHTITERINSLVAGRTDGLTATAMLLGVSAGALARSMNVRDPHPSVEVLVAVVREYGVDPAWLLYGTYDSATHAAAMNLGRSLNKDDFLRLVESPRFACVEDPPELRPRTQLD